MRTAADYIEQAKEMRGLSSDSQLARQLDITPTSLCNIKNGKTPPAPATLLKLANLAQIPDDQAALDLSRWRAEREGATWMVHSLEQLFRHVAGPAALVAMLAIMTPQHAKAAELRDLPRNVVVQETVYYGYRRFRRWLRKALVKLGTYTAWRYA